MSTPSFERLYRRHAGDVYRFALAVVRNPQEAEDVTQTTFLNAYRALQRGHVPERAKSWLFAIAHNAIRSRRRWTLRRPKEVPLEAAVHELAVPPEDEPMVREVLHALSELPESQRVALALRELEGRSYGEIAETLGVTVSAVESLIARARRTLRSRRASLRGLTVVQLPRSLRTFLENNDASGMGLAAKAAVVVATASAIAGTVGGVAPNDAGASKHPTPAPRHEPSRPSFTATRGTAPAGVAQPTHRPAAHAPTTAKTSPTAKHAPAPMPLPPVVNPTAPAKTTPPGVALPTPTAPAQVPADTPVVGGTKAPTPPTAPTLPTLPTPPSVPTSTDPSTWQAPQPPTLPEPPQPPTPPSVPQVKPPTGIK